MLPALIAGTTATVYIDSFIMIQSADCREFGGSAECVSEAEDYSTLPPFFNCHNAVVIQKCKFPILRSNKQAAHCYNKIKHRARTSNNLFEPLKYHDIKKNASKLNTRQPLLFFLASLISFPCCLALSTLSHCPSSLEVPRKRRKRPQSRAHTHEQRLKHMY